MAGGPVENVPGENDVILLRVPLGQLVPTRFNPRRNFGTEDDLKAFGQVLAKRQLQPAVVVSRAAYLKLWPDEAESVGQAAYVIANGERRYRGSRAAGLTHLDIVHREEVAQSRAEFLDAVLSENNDREDLDPIERALGIETMVTELGGAGKVAEHYGKTDGWVSQQRKLLKLTPALQSLVSAGKLPIRVGREIASLPAGDQEAEWERQQEARREAAERPRPKRTPAAFAVTTVAPPAAPGPEGRAVADPERTEPPAAEEEQQAVVFTAVKTTVPEQPSAEVHLAPPPQPLAPPPPRAEAKPAAAAVTAASIPWSDPEGVLAILREHMADADLKTLIKLAQK